MKKSSLLILSGVAVLLLSCETRKDVLHQLNSNPKVYVSTVEDDFSKKSNSVDVTLRHGCSQTVYFNYEVSDTSSVKVECAKFSESGNAEFIVFSLDRSARNIVISDTLLKTTLNEKIVKCSVKIVVTDYYEDQGEAVINIVDYDNRPPVPSIVLSQIQNMEYTIDASATTDADGDEVVAYEYLIDGQIVYDKSGYEDPSDSTCHINPGGSSKQGTYIISTPLSTVKHAFQSDGTHAVCVRAKDALGLWSRWYSVSVDVQ